MSHAAVSGRITGSALVVPRFFVVQTQFSPLSSSGSKKGEYKMNRRLVPWMVLWLAVCLVESPSSFALQNQLNQDRVPCGSHGVLFTNLSTQPTNFDIAAYGGAVCKVTYSWIDANGISRTLSVSHPPASTTVPTSTFLPSHGASSTLKPGGSISWSVAAGSDFVNLNVVIERPPSTLVPSSTTTLGSATFGAVGGPLYSTGLICGSRGTLFNNLTSAPINFDLLIQNQSPPVTVGSVTDNCGITVFWRDTAGTQHTINLQPFTTQAVSATNIPAGGIIGWISSGEPNTKATFYWEFERSVTIQGQTF
jgi:hypothetical protein